MTLELAPSVVPAQSTSADGEIVCGSFDFGERRQLTMAQLHRADRADWFDACGKQHWRRLGEPGTTEGAEASEPFNQRTD